MDRLPSLHRFIAPLPIRWRLALVSFGLLFVLLAALGLLLSITEEDALLAGQATVLKNEADIAQLQLRATKAPLPVSQILTFPAMSKNVASGLLGAIHYALGQNVGVSILAFDGGVLAADTDSSNVHTAPVVTLARSSVQQWFVAHPSASYLLADDNQGQRELVVLQPIAGWDKSLNGKGTVEDPPGYTKALLQLSVPTTAIDQSVATTRLILILGILAALGIAAALTLPLINVALRPLVEMERVSSRIAAGSLSLRLAEPAAQDEIGRMARAFNSMVAHLEATFARQRRFVADVSHELRTPLTGLGGSLEMLLLRADNGDEETARRLMSGMHAEVERMQHLVADLLALTRLDEGRVKLRVEAVDVSQLVNEVCEQMQRLLHGQELCYQVPSDLPALRGDVDQLRRVLLNVVENAVKFTPPAGRVELAVHGECIGFVTFEVRDTGIGIPPEALPHVFDRFYRADPSRTRLSLQAGGSGLGLSIAKELVEAHGGTITMSSIVAEGTAVTIRLPAMH
ncbi:MAG TPA: HAMP domain-containing sensor histidine kinase [Ktedonosporobacter sp.]|jgi:signal transduction histidine kinase|nr:HAMP domain-containing sensor histidine kinase [Ktedonosporobacter sp.]